MHVAVPNWSCHNNIYFIRTMFSQVRHTKVNTLKILSVLIKYSSFGYQQRVFIPDPTLYSFEGLLCLCRIQYCSYIQTRKVTYTRRGFFDIIRRLLRPSYPSLPTSPCRPTTVDDSDSAHTPYPCDKINVNYKVVDGVIFTKSLYTFFLSLWVLVIRMVYPVSLPFNTWLLLQDSSTSRDLMNTCSLRAG